MNKAERLYRFGEIMSAVGLLPDIDVDDDSQSEIGSEIAKEWLLPSLSGVSDSKLSNAILCQAQREDVEFKFKLIALLTNSALRSISDSAEKDEKPSEDDLYAIAISANVLWSEGQVKGLYQLLGLLSTVCNNFDMKVPILATAFLRTNDGIENFGKLDPIALLSGELTSDDVDGVMNQYTGE